MALPSLLSLRSLRNRRSEVVGARDRAPVLSWAHYFQVPATQARLCNADRVSGLNLHP